MLITQGYDGGIGSNVVLDGFGGSTGRSFPWETDTNSVPLLTAPTINVVYASDRKSATVTMSCDVNEATIKYSTNGRYATTNCNSPIYTGPITIYQSGVFHACWYFNGLKSYAAHASVYLKL
jgi:hypothetical protein